MRGFQQVSRTFFIVLCTLLLSASVFAAEVQITILHTNDHHGHFMKFDPYPVQGVGGLAAQMTLVNIVRAEVEEAGGHVLVLSAGDVNTGIPESDLLDAEPDFKLMNMIGYDAMTLGNHEFDNPREVLMKQRGWAEFPFLSANIVKKDIGEPLVEPYVIKEFEGVKVAIFGLTSDRTPILTLPENTADLEFKDPVATAKELVPELKKQADLVIALTHLGFYEKDSANYQEGDLYLAEQVPEIDVIVGGHTHTEMTEPKMAGNTLIVQAGGYSEAVGRLDLTIETDADEVTASEFKLVPVNMKKRVKYNDKSYYMYVDKGYVEDSEALESMAAYLTQADELLSQPVGQAAVELVGGKSESRSQETNLGNLITDAMRAKTGAEIAFQNGGGIRAGIAPGEITYRDILTVQPFGNTLTTLSMNGEQIMEVLNFAATLDSGSGGFLHVSGVSWTLNRQTKSAENVMVNGEPLDMNRVYEVVTNNFMAAGGDGYAMLKDIPQYDTGFVDADAIKDYIIEKGTVEPSVEGRLTIIE